MTTRKPFAPIAAAAFIAVWAMVAQAQEAKPHPWDAPYAGEDAGGEHVVAFWRFEAGAEAEDSSGHGHSLKLRGKARFSPDGRFGGCLESFRAVEDTAEGASAPRRPALSPRGAFSVELWFRPKPELAEQKTAFLVDCKYFHYNKDIPRAHTGYVFHLRPTGAGFQPTVMLGFGKDSVNYAARAVELKPGEWRHLAFMYDGAGTVRILLDGEDIGGGTDRGRGDITPARYDLVIGDRVGSIHSGCAGSFDEVRITKGVLTPNLAIGTGTGRTAFVRMEKDARATVDVTNVTGKQLSPGAVRVEFGGGERELELPGLAPGQVFTVDVPVDAAVRPGSYDMKVTVSAEADGKTYKAERVLPVVIVPRPLPHVMPVVLWGGGDLERVKAIGFTHHIRHMGDMRRIWDAGEPTQAMADSAVASVSAMLDEHLAAGVGVVVYPAPGRWVMKGEKLREKYQRIDRAGKPYEGHTSVNGLFPEVQQFCYNVGASIAKTFGHFPALQASLIQSEVRGATQLSFHEIDKNAFREHAGFSMPREITSKSGANWAGVAGFPADRIIPDDDRLLTFYRWFWKDGDGWNELHSKVSEGLHSTGRDDLWTWYDPAVRVPSIWGSGGRVDVISQWTYSYPDPIKIGQATDELFAMVAGRPGQKVMKMTQVIWYRRGTAPIPKMPEDESQRTQWERDIPDAAFVTIAPDHMREAFWCKIARPVQGIMYHGWGSLVKLVKPRGYRFTNPRTAEVLTELTRDVVRPLGPALLQIPDRKSDVALLESFSAQMYGARGPWGWSQGWIADAHLVLQWAHLQPRIIYDEHILRDGLADYKVLVLPRCDVLTRSVYEKILQFQDRGGIIVGDSFLAPALTPDILLEPYKRTRKADEDKAALQTKAAELRRDLDTVYERCGDVDNPDVVLRFRQYGDTDYLFAINDKRTYGKYVGQYGLVMEKGLPNAATIRVKRDGGCVYDLVAHKPVTTESSDGNLTFAAEFGPGAGRLFMITSRKVNEVRLVAPARAALGGAVEIQVSVVDPEGAAIAAIVPVELEVIDAKGRPAEFSGFYGAKDGRLSLKLDLARNDAPGQWTVRARELASGLVAEHRLQVAP